MRTRRKKEKGKIVIITLDEVRVIGLVWRQHRRHLVVVCRVHVLVNAVPGQLYLLRRTRVILTGEGTKKCATVRKCGRADLRQSQMDRCRLRDVHDLPVWCHDEDESVQRLRGRERKREASGYYLSVLPQPRPCSDSNSEYWSCTCSK